ncbi:MAG: ABC transporter ATP-binding protein [Clostridia bacterium]|nr:ABC transporter ATP-binding protein [Clostridia bacterium]
MKSILEVKNLSFGYEKNKKVLNDVNLSIEDGSITAILGKNGCGKSTLLDCIIGYNEYDEGQVIVDNADIKGFSPKELSRKIAYISQNTTINLDYTVLEFILFGRTCHLAFGSAPKEKDYKIAKENAEKLGITHLLSKDINKISGGERQLAFIARALTQESKIIIMDEPTASLDYGNQLRLFEIIKELKEKGKTIVFTTHNPEHVKLLGCNVAIINDGEIIKKGAASKIITKEFLVEIYGEIVKRY